MLVEETCKSTSNIWANDWNPEIETVSRENVTSIYHCSENSKYFRKFCKKKAISNLPWAKVTSRVEWESAVVSERHTDSTDCQTNENWSNTISDLIFLVSNCHDGENKDCSSNDLIQAKDKIKPKRLILTVRRWWSAKREWLIIIVTYKQMPFEISSPCG